MSVALNHLKGRSAAPRDAAGEDFSKLAAHPFLQGMARRHLQLLLNSAMSMSFDGGQLIFSEGDLANRFYLIECGEVALEADAGCGRSVLIGTLGPGEVLGWSWLFPPYYWRFSARTLQPTRAMFFYGTRLRQQCEEDHAFGYELIKRVAAVAIARLHATRGQLLEEYHELERIRSAAGLAVKKKNAGQRE